MGLFKKETKKETVKESRKPFPLSDTEVIARSLLGISDYYDRTKNFRPFNVDECVEYVTFKFKSVYKEARGYKYSSDTLKAEDALEMSAIYKRIEATLLEEARKRAMAKAATLKARQISKVGAAAAIRSAFSETGYTTEIEAQCYRAKVSIMLKDKYSMTMIIPYKAIREGKLDDFISHFKRMASAIEESPYEVFLRKYF